MQVSFILFISYLSLNILRFFYFFFITNLCYIISGSRTLIHHHILTFHRRNN